MSTIEQLSDEQRLRLLVDAVVDYALYVIGLDGRVVSWNAGAQRLKGYTPEEIIGQPFSRFFTPADLEAGLPERALRVAREVGRFEAEGWRIRKDGSRFWANAILDAIRDATGEVIGFVKITRDLSERQQAQQELLESERRYRLLIDAVVDYAIFQLGPDGTVTTWNPGAQRIKGYKPSEIIGQHFSRFYLPEDRAAGVPDQALETARSSGRYEAEGWRLRNDGTRFWASVVIDRIQNEAGETVGFAKITRDITERLRAQERLKEAQDQLAASQKMEAIGQLSGGIAHDFNNLLMIVLGNLENAQRTAREGSPPNLQRSIANAIRGAQRAAALTSRLLAFSRRQALDPKPLDLNRFLSGTVDFLQRSLGETIQIEHVGTAGLWQVELDSNQLETALVNLAVNARDAMPDGGRLTIETSNVWIDEDYCRSNPETIPGQYVLICVTDTGTGMTAETMNRAFEPFFTTKEIGQGTGLGLSQVYGFVKQSGGQVKLYTEPDIGTTVKLYFPRYMREQVRITEDEEEESWPEGEPGESILLVEDDEDVRSYLAEALRALNYRVMTAPDARAALKTAQRDIKIDLLITDVVMPGMNGRELALAAQELRPDLLVLFISGYSRNAILSQGRVPETIDLLQKPISQQTLSAKIRSVLDNAARQRTPTRPLM